MISDSGSVGTGFPRDPRGANVITSPCDASHLLEKWSEQSTPVYGVFVGPDKAIKFSFFGLVARINFPRVEFNSFISEFSVDLEGAAFRISDLRDTPAGYLNPLAERGEALEAVFPDGAVCTFIEFHR